MTDEWDTRSSLSDMIDGADEMAIQTMEFAMPPSDLA
jgi:hypothetical protein